jgi:hypothetical protein
MAGIMEAPAAFLEKHGVKNVRIIFWGIGAAAVVIIGIVVYKKVKGIGAGMVTSAETYSELSDQLNNVSVNTSKLTITNSDATIIAQNLLNAMDRWGTDEESILDNLSRVRSKDDLNLIIKTFGIRPKSFSGLADTFLESHFEGVMKNLAGWLRDELSGSELKAVKAIFDQYGVSF